MYTDNSLITPSLTDLLKKNEKVEFIQQCDKQALMRSVRLYLLIALGTFLLFDGYLFMNGMSSDATIGAIVLAIFFFNIPTLLALGAAYRTYQRVNSAFYALTNMRIIHTKLTALKKMDSIYFKDIHEVSPHKNSVKIDLNDFGEYTKRFRYIHGIKDPKDLCDKIETRLESFRLGPQ